MANKKTLVRFNVQNVKYAVPTAQGSFGVSRYGNVNETCA